jgi:hypothetical protein
VTALWTSFLVVALAEMGDKTQLIALALAARFRRAWTVMLGILIATTLNHALAATAGVWIARRLPPAALAWTLAIGFIAFGIWTLVPDDAPETPASARWGPLLTTIVVFFLAEMGDKTQLATVALGARFVGRVGDRGQHPRHAGRRWRGRLRRLVSRPAGLARDAAPHRGHAFPAPRPRGADRGAPHVVSRDSSTAIHKVSRIPSLPTSWG